jgi:hypothetical protein
MSMFDMYCLMKLDDIQTLFFIISIILFILGFVFCIVMDAQENFFDFLKNHRNLSLLYTIIFIMSTLLATFLPSTKQMAAIIVVTKITNYIQNNEKLKQIPDKLIDLSNEWLDELSPNKKDKK